MSYAAFMSYVNHYIYIDIYIYTYSVMLTCALGFAIIYGYTYVGPREKCLHCGKNPSLTVQIGRRIHRQNLYP